MSKMKIKVLRDLPHCKTGKPNGHKKGDIIEVETKTGIPKSQYWRDRLKDSEIDGCCEIVKPKQSTLKAGEK